jgi:hypothetical protein
MPSGIPTTYNGIHFRSRLEAGNEVQWNAP